MTTTKIINVFTENIYPDWEIDEVKCIAITRKIVEYYLEQLLDISCLDGFDFESLTFDILFCDSEKTHQINRDYRNKDYPADMMIPTNDPYYLASKLIELYPNYDLQKKMSELNYNIAHFRHDADSIYMSLVEGYKTILASKK